MSDRPDDPVRVGKEALELPPEEMRRLGYRVVDLLVERWTDLEAGPAWVGGSREEMEAALREEPPDEGGAPDEVLDRAVSGVLANAAPTNHPRFFAFVPSSPTWPSILGDFLATGFNVFQGTWLESPGPSQVELVVTDWFRRWLDMPDDAGGLLTSGGSAANLVALVAARERAGNPSEPALYLSEEGHSSLARAARIAGIPPEAVVRIPVDRDFRMDVDAVRSRVRSDRKSGRVPICVCASAGATNTGAVDPLDDLARVCAEEDVWLHVDAAYGGFAVLTDEGRAALAGIGAADSVTLDPHKWLFQPYEAGCVLARDVGALEEAFHVLPDYLQDVDLGMEHVNFADRGIQLTRKFRALKIWLSIQMFGLDAFRRTIGDTLELARRAEARIRTSQELELLSPASLGVVCFRFRPPGRTLDSEALEELNEGIQDRIVQSGFAMMSSTRLRGQYALRFCILNHRSHWEHVRETLERVERLGRERCAS